MSDTPDIDKTELCECGHAAFWHEDYAGPCGNDDLDPCEYLRTFRQWTMERIRERYTYSEAWGEAREQEWYREHYAKQRAGRQQGGL